MTDFANPAVNPEANFAGNEPGPIYLKPGNVSTEELDVVVKAVYRQVLGNVHIMESDRLISSESLLKNGDISVREFVRQVAKSELYASLFFDGCSYNRFIELNFKHLLGRAPESYDDFASHSRIITEQGYGAEIDSYLDSDEYSEVFGENIVPYVRGSITQPGQSSVGFTNMMSLEQGFAASDAAFSKISKLNQRAMIAHAAKATEAKAAAAWAAMLAPVVKDVAPKGGFRGLPTFEPIDVPDAIVQQRVGAPKPNAVQPYPQYQSNKGAVDFKLRWDSDNPVDVEEIIQAVYRQVLGNVHVMESERLTVAESQLANGTFSVKEFVRSVALSDLYKSRFFEGCSNNRFIELNFIHLLGRAPNDYEDFASHGRTLTEQGYEAEISSYLDSPEYDAAFGEDYVPYARGYSSQDGQKLVGFTHMFSLMRGSASSDRDRRTNESRLNTTIFKAQPTSIVEPSRSPHPWQRPAPVTDERAIYKPVRPPVVKAQPTPIGAGENYNDASSTFNGEPLPQYRRYQSFVASEKVEWFGGSEEDAEQVIAAVYRQVLGNAHIMESERLTKAESQLRNGTFSVREFVRAVAQSELYKSRFFNGCSNNRFIELNFKHLLGRTPSGYEDFAIHGRILTEQGYDEEINSYLDSDEYRSTFGEDIVPSPQGFTSPTGQKLVGFTYMFALNRGSASSDLVQGNTACVDEAALTDQASQIVPPSTPELAWTVNRSNSLVVTDIKKLLSKVLNIPQQPVDEKGIVREEPKPVVMEEVDLDRYQQYQGYKAFDNTPIFELIPGEWESEDDFQAVVRAVYRQVLGNAYVMESERLTKPESQLHSGEINVREFVRQVAKSELYRSRFFTPCYRYRAIELNFKHILGRAPDNYQEMIPHSDILDAKGYNADIDSYIDSDEYQNAFGENIVPYYRYKTRDGQSMLGFTNTFGLLASASSSDKDPRTNNAPRVMTAIMLNSPYGAKPGTDARSIAEEAIKETTISISEAVNETLSSEERRELIATSEEQKQKIANLEKRLDSVRSLSNLAASMMKQTPVKEVVRDMSSTAAIIAMFDNDELNELRNTVKEQGDRIKQLEKDLMAANSLASVAEYRLNSWRLKSF
ncbi:MAG: phycobilisome rod-core linker polypeptide [Cyanobacteria bacterium P01_F01_bin.150]